MSALNAYREIWRGGAAVLVGAVLVSSGCGGKRDVSGTEGAAGSCDAGTGRITIATGNSTGVYYVLGGGLAQVISSNTKLRATAAETGASVQNIDQLVRGDNDIAFSLADTAPAAVAGTGGFEGKKQPVRAAREEPHEPDPRDRPRVGGIDSIADMRGKTVSTGSPKSGTEVIANRLLRAAGLDPARDVKAQRLRGCTARRLTCRRSSCRTFSLSARTYRPHACALQLVPAAGTAESQVT